MAALSALLRRGATTYTLSISDEFAPPNLQVDVSIVGGTGPASPRLVREQRGAPVPMIVPIIITKTTQALFQAELDTLNAYLALGACTLEVTFTDANAATIWNVYHAQPVQPPFNGPADLAHWTLTALQLVVSPFVTTSEVTLHNAAALTNPDSLGLSGMVGTYKAPLTLEWNATSANTHAFYAAIDASSFDAYRSDAKDLTWSGGETDYADADSFTGTAAKIASLTARTAPIATADYPAGPYLILARVKVLGGETGYLSTDYTADTPVTFTRASWHIVELGRCYLPSRVVRGSALASLTLSAYGSSASGGDEVCIDWVYALPIGAGMFSWHPVTETTQCDTIGRDAATGITYIDDVSDEQHVTGHTLMALGGTLLIVSQDTAGTDPTHNGALTVKYTPRYAWMR